MAVKLAARRRALVPWISASNLLGSSHQLAVIQARECAGDIRYVGTA